MHQYFKNLIPESYSDLLLKEFENNSSWMFTPSASNVGENYDKNDPNIRDSTQFVHAILGYSNAVSPLVQSVVPIVWFFEKETGIKIKNILRIKANCLTRDGNDYKYNPPHVDVYDPGFISMVYYINDSDGDTILFDKMIADGHDNLTPVERIKPSKGSLLAFPSNQLHASSCPIENKQRLVINFILEPQ